MSHTYSLSWASPETKESEKFQVCINAMRRTFPRSEVAQMDMPAWLEHRQAIIQARGRQLGRMVAIKEEQLKRGLPPIATPLKGKSLMDNRSTVLCQKTIWCSKWDLKIEKAPWPTLTELKWEGDDRAKTSVGRFLPLPREPGNATVAWHHLRMLPAFEFDECRNYLTPKFWTPSTPTTFSNSTRADYIFIVAGNQQMWWGDGIRHGVGWTSPATTNLGS